MACDQDEDCAGLPGDFTCETGAGLCVQAQSQACPEGCASGEVCDPDTDACVPDPDACPAPPACFHVAGLDGCDDGACVPGDLPVTLEAPEPNGFVGETVEVQGEVAWPALGSLEVRCEAVHVDGDGGEQTLDVHVLDAVASGSGAEELSTQPFDCALTLIENPDAPPEWADAPVEVTLRVTAKASIEDSEETRSGTEALPVLVDVAPPTVEIEEVVPDQVARSGDVVASLTAADAGGLAHIDLSVVYAEGDPSEPAVEIAVFPDEPDACEVTSSVPDDEEVPESVSCHVAISVVPADFAPSPYVVRVAASDRAQEDVSRARRHRDRAAAELARSVALERRLESRSRSPRGGDCGTL